MTRITIATNEPIPIMTLWLAVPIIVFNRMAKRMTKDESCADEPASVKL